MTLNRPKGQLSRVIGSGGILTACVLLLTSSGSPTLDLVQRGQILVTPSLAQVAGTPSDSQPLCAENLAAIETKVRANYAGFQLEVRGKKLQRFETMKRALQERAARTTGDACFYALREFIEWFDDPHLFVYQSDRLDTIESRHRATLVETRDLTEASARAYYGRADTHLDPVEGIWYDRGLRVAIVPDSARGRRHFAAVVLSSDTSTLGPGAIVAHFTRGPGERYQVDLLGRNYSLRHLRANIYRHVLLRFSPGLWGKEFPVTSADSGTLDPADPHRPTLTHRRATVVISVPSDDPSIKPTLDTMIKAHHDELAGVERLILDLRGNEGGSSSATNALDPFISTKEQKPDSYSGNAVMLSSDDQIAYAHRAFGSDTSMFVRELLARLTLHPGKLVPIDDPAAPPSAPDSRDWVVTTGPRRVGVLIDQGTVSAAEVLVLRALRSGRATVFGERTAGALDYQSVNIVRLSPREHRWFLGYPTITRSADLPKNAMRGKGIPPQVRLDLAKISDPVGYIDRYLDRR